MPSGPVGAAKSRTGSWSYCKHFEDFAFVLHTLVATRNLHLTVLHLTVLALGASPQVLHVAEGPARTRARLHLTVLALRALPQVLNVTEGTAPT